MKDVISKEKFVEKLCAEFGINSFDELPDYVKQFANHFIKYVNQNNTTAVEFDDFLRRLESEVEKNEL